MLPLNSLLSIQTHPVHPSSVSGVEPKMPRGGHINETTQKEIQNSPGTTQRLNELSATTTAVASNGANRVEKLALKNPVFANFARKNGMSADEIEECLNYIDKHLPSWVAGGEKKYISKKDSGLVRPIEYLPFGEMVVAHFKRKKKSRGVKGRPFVKGFSSNIKQSMIISRKAGPRMVLANKGPTNKSDQTSIDLIDFEGKITGLFSESKNVRRIVRFGTKSLLLEEMEGGALSDHIGSTPFNSHQKAKIAFGLFNGMREIHNKGLIHQDIQSANCFLTEDGSAKVGELKYAVNKTSQDNGKGSFHTFSPERLKAKVNGYSHYMDIKDDIWSMGLVFYQLEHGDLPDFAKEELMIPLQCAIQIRDRCKWGTIEYNFAQNHLETLFHQHLSKIQSFLKNWIPQPGLDSLITNMLKLEVNERYHHEDIIIKLLSNKNLTIEKTILDEYMHLCEDTIIKLLSSKDLTIKKTVLDKYIHLCIDKRNATLLKRLINKRNELQYTPPLNELKDSQGETLLHLALGSPYLNLNLLSYLLDDCDFKAIVNAKNKEGQTPLHFAVIHHQYAFGRLLISYGADLKIKDNSNREPLDYQTPWKEESLVEGERLLKALSGNKEEPNHLLWHLNAAILLDQMFLKDIDEATKHRLKLLLLHGYSKAAPLPANLEDGYGIQKSPLLKNVFFGGLDPARYHRSSKNELLEVIYKAYAKKMEVSAGEEVTLVHSSLIREVIARETRIMHYDIRNQAEMKQKIVKALENRASDLQKFYRPGKGIKPLVFDITDLLKAASKDHKDMKKFMNLLQNICDEFIRGRQFNFPENILLENIQLMACTAYQGQDLIVSKWLKPAMKGYEKALDTMMTYSGFRLSPDQAKEAWLNIADLEEILAELMLPAAVLTTPSFAPPRAVKNFQEFLAQPLVKKFKMLSESSNAPPYLKVLPIATCRLLEGFATVKVDQKFEEKGIQNLLQFSYYLIQESMRNAIFRKDDPVAFYNCIELIHQQIQTLLAICEPCDKDSLADSVREKLLAEPNPTLPKELGKPLVYLKPSAMHCVSSAFAGAVAQTKKDKGIDQLNVVVLKDCYFETVGASQKDNTHNTSFLCGEKFKKEGIDHAFVGERPNQPIDLMVGEFHHNISLKTSVYSPENILEQIKALKQKGMLAKKFTLILDTTIDLEISEDIRNFLADATIKQMIQDGQLNVVLLRSSQKFDMFGLDNYYGGITISLNNPSFFNEFNQRMNVVEDQLTGLSYQGVAHLQKWGGSSLDDYRSAVMENNHKLYNKLPPQAIYKEGSKNLYQVARIEDKRTMFLDIIFNPSHEKFRQEWIWRFMKMAKEEQIPIPCRDSFGFMTTNLVILQDEDNLKIRLTVGLDSEKTIDRFAAFFHAVQNEFEDVMKNSPGKTEADIEKSLVERMQKLVIPKIY